MPLCRRASAIRIELEDEDERSNTPILGCVAGVGSGSTETVFELGGERFRIASKISPELSP
jgi:hypothetical protein